MTSKRLIVDDYYFNIMVERLVEHHLSSAENKKEAQQKFDGVKLTRKEKV